MHADEAGADHQGDEGTADQHCQQQGQGIYYYFISEATLTVIKSVFLFLNSSCLILGMGKLHPKKKPFTPQKRKISFDYKTDHYLFTFKIDYINKGKNPKLHHIFSYKDDGLF